MKLANGLEENKRNLILATNTIIEQVRQSSEESCQVAVEEACRAAVRQELSKAVQDVAALPRFNSQVSPSQSQLAAAASLSAGASPAAPCPPGMRPVGRSSANHSDTNSSEGTESSAGSTDHHPDEAPMEVYVPPPPTMAWFKKMMPTFRQLYNEYYGNDQRELRYGERLIVGGFETLENDPQFRGWRKDYSGAQRKAFNRAKRILLAFRLDMARKSLSIEDALTAMENRFKGSLYGLEQTLIDEKLIEPRVRGRSSVPNPTVAL